MKDIGKDTSESMHHPEQTINAILCYIKKDGKYLLQLKAKNRFGGGLWNAPGGKVKSGETAEEAVKREIKEETGLNIEKAEHMGSIEFFNGARKTRPDWVVEVFLSSKFNGTQMKESEEGKLQWFSKEEIPLDQMWPDDKHWLPLMLDGKKFHGKFFFEEDGKTMASHEVKVM